MRAPIRLAMSHLLAVADENMITAIGRNKLESSLEAREIMLEAAMVKEISLIFEMYNRLYGKKFKVLRMRGPGQALKLVKKSLL